MIKFNLFKIKIQFFVLIVGLSFSGSNAFADHGINHQLNPAHAWNFQDIKNKKFILSNKQVPDSKTVEECPGELAKEISFVYELRSSPGQGLFSSTSYYPDLLALEDAKFKNPLFEYIDQGRAINNVRYYGGSKFLSRMLCTMDLIPSYRLSAHEICAMWIKDDINVPAFNPRVQSIYSTYTTNNAIVFDSQIMLEISPGQMEETERRIVSLTRTDLVDGKTALVYLSRLKAAQGSQIETILRCEYSQKD